MEKSDLKEQIAKDFLCDAEDYLKRFKLLERESMNHIGMKSKLYLELCFSTECCLKALYLLTTTETNLQNAYKKIIKHDLTKLLGILPETEQSEVAKYISDVMKEFSVENRYKFEVSRKFRIFDCLARKYYNAISNIVFLENEAKNIEILKEYVEKKVKHPCECINVCKLSDKMIEEMWNEMQIKESLHK